jgi:hypothetical protein
MSGLPGPVKTSLLKSLSVGDNMLPSTSAWRSDGFQALTKNIMQSINVQEYNAQIMYKEQLFEDKEWFVELSDGKDIIEAIAA